MGLLAEAFNPRPLAEVPGYGTDPLNPFWYTDPSGYMVEGGLSGIPLSADTLLRCGTVLAAVRFRGDAAAMCPPSTYMKTETGRKEQPNHYSQRVLRRPNLWQTGNRWRHVNNVWLALWGNAYNEMVPGRTSFADELRPMHPDPAITRVVDQRADGSLVYLHKPSGEDERRLGQERVLHFRDLSTDGIQGVPMYKLIRNLVGIALLAEKHTTTFLRKGSRLAGLLAPAAKLDKAQKDELRTSANDMGGPNMTGTFGVMPYGVTLTQIAATHRDSQFYEISEQVVGAILRFLGVPGVVVGYMGDKTATYASAKEFFDSGGLKHCVLPILINMEAEEEKALLPADSGLQIKHNMGVLERANLKDRTESLFKAIGGPFLTVNEGRRIEDLNELADPRYDEVLTPANMSPDGFEEPEPPAPAPAPFAPSNPPPDDGDDERSESQGHGSYRGQDSERPELLNQYAHDNAVRVVRREIKAVLARAPKHARDNVLWRSEVLKLYGKHVDHVASVMRITPEKARTYCDAQAASLLASGAGVVETWEKEIPPRLVAMALGETSC